MVNNIKAFWRYPATGMGIIFAFVIVCLGGTVIFGPESFFYNYIQGGVMMFFIMVTVLGSSTTRSLVNIGLAMGAVRKSLWAAIQLNIVVQALVCLPMQALLNWGAGCFGLEGILLLPPRGIAALALFLLLWAMGALGAWLSLVQKTGWKIFGWGLAVILYLGYIAAMIAHMIFSLFSMDIILWGICTVSLVAGGAASFGLYRQCRIAQVNWL